MPFWLAQNVVLCLCIACSGSFPQGLKSPSYEVNWVLFLKFLLFCEICLPLKMKSRHSLSVPGVKAGSLYFECSYFPVSGMLSSHCAGQLCSSQRINDTQDLLGLHLPSFLLMWCFLSWGSQRGTRQRCCKTPLLYLVGSEFSEPIASLHVHEVSFQSTKVFYKHGAPLARWQSSWATQRTQTTLLCSRAVGAPIALEQDSSCNTNPFRRAQLGIW